MVSESTGSPLGVRSRASCPRRAAEAHLMARRRTRRSQGRVRGTKTPIRHLTSRFTTNPAVVAGVTSTMARDFAGATPY
jgi:hypothetical protein